MKSTIKLYPLLFSSILAAGCSTNTRPEIERSNHFDVTVKSSGGVVAPEGENFIERVTLPRPRFLNLFTPADLGTSIDTYGKVKGIQLKKTIPEIKLRSGDIFLDCQSKPVPSPKTLILCFQTCQSKQVLDITYERNFVAKKLYITCQ